MKIIPEIGSIHIWVWPSSWCRLFYISPLGSAVCETRRKADRFALKIGIKPEVMITALLKVARLNHMALKQKKLDEKFQLHPSMARRIGRIEKISGYKYNLVHN